MDEEKVKKIHTIVTLLAGTVECMDRAVVSLLEIEEEEHAVKLKTLADTFKLGCAPIVTMLGEELGIEEEQIEESQETEDSQE